MILNWPELERSRQHVLQQGPVFSGASVQALGYMMEGDRPVRAGDWIDDFVLLPDAGSFLHSAHQFGDHMITVHLTAGGHIQFSPRSLVWVRGTLRAPTGDAAGTRPLYDLELARAAPATKTDIQRYFR